MGIIHKVALLGAALMLLAAPVQAKTTITFWHGMGGELGEITDSMLKEFNESQDKYEVKGVYKGNYDEAMTAAIAAFRAKQHPNIIQIFEVGTASMMAAKKAIRPMHDIMAAAGTPLDNSRFVPSVASYYMSSDQKLMAMPFNASTTVLYFNKDAVKKAGGDPENFPKTWPEVAALAEKIKASGACKYGMTSGWQSWVQLESFSAWHNVPFATQNNGYGGLNTELCFNSPLQVKHIDFLSQLQKKGVFVYVGRKSEAINTFTSGEAGILMNSSGSYAAVKAGAKFGWGVAVLPYWPEVQGAPQNTVIGGAAIWAMAGHSKDSELGVAAFMNYLLKPEVQAKFHQITGYVPVTLEGYELTKKQGFYEKNPGTDQAIVSLSAKAPTLQSSGLRLGNFVQIRSIVDEELEAVWSGKKTAQEALDAAVTRGNVELRRFEKANSK
jgi:sn-glycerol 3-phosphate transport system substrate-binding protein